MKYKTRFVGAPKGVYERQRMLGGTESKESDCWFDGEGLAREVETVCNQFDAEGYEVMSITDTTRGNYSISGNGGAGWSMTFGVLITARRS